MNLPSSSALRHVVAALLMLTLTLAGVGRGWAVDASSPGAVPSIPGVAFHICHAGGGGGDASPSQPAHHDCCDQCALCAPVLVPAAARFAEPVAIAQVADHAHGLAWAPAAVRTHTPKQSQGPPAA